MNKEGRKFSLKGRDWVTDEFWKPLHSWRIVANDSDNLCDTCRGIVWQMIPWEPWAQKGQCESCSGTKLEPILVLVLNLPRREGKTFNVAATAISEICQRRNRTVYFVATAGDQNKRLFEDNYRTPIESSPVLRGLCEIVGERITVKSTGSQFRYATTSSANAVTGGGVSLLILDECRDLKPRTAMAAIGSTRDQGGKECPYGHVNLANNENSPDDCPACGATLIPWFPQVILTSSSGIETGTDMDWFNDLVMSQTGGEGVPVANVHTFRMQESSNPVVSSAVTSAYDAFFSQSDALKTYVDVEMHNIPRRAGADFLSNAALKAVTDSKLGKLNAIEDRCFVFLDTSTTSDLTNLVVVAEDSEKCVNEPWEHIYVARIDRWDPAKSANGVVDIESVRQTLLDLLPRLPNMMAMYIDVRGGITWATDMVMFLRNQGQSWSKRVCSYAAKKSFHQTLDRDTSWALLEQRVLSRKIRFPPDNGLAKELRGVQKRVRTDGTVEVRDRNRKQSHADVAESIAICCLLIFREQSRPRVGLSDLKKSAPPATRKGLGRYLTGAGSLKGDNIV